MRFARRNFKISIFRAIFSTDVQQLGTFVHMLGTKVAIKRSFEF